MRLLWFRGSHRVPIWQIVVPGRRTAGAGGDALLQRRSRRHQGDALELLHRGDLGARRRRARAGAARPVATRVGRGLAAARGPGRLVGRRERRRCPTWTACSASRSSSADNNGIPRSRTVPSPVWRSLRARRRDDHAVPGVPLQRRDHVRRTSRSRHASGDVRLLATPERVVPLAGQPAFAWTPGRQFQLDGTRSPYCLRGRARADGRAGGGGGPRGARRDSSWSGSSGTPARSSRRPPRPRVLAARDAGGGRVRGAGCWPTWRRTAIEVGQFHAEYGLAQMELSIAAVRPGDGGRPAAAGPPDDPRRRPRARAAGVVRAARVARVRRQRLAPAQLGAARRPQPARGRRRASPG